MDPERQAHRRPQPGIAAPEGRLAVSVPLEDAFPISFKHATPKQEISLQSNLRKFYAGVWAAQTGWGCC